MDLLVFLFLDEALCTFFFIFSLLRFFFFLISFVMIYTILKAKIYSFIFRCDRPRASLASVWKFE